MIGKKTYEVWHKDFVVVLCAAMYARERLAGKADNPVFPQNGHDTKPKGQSTHILIRTALDCPDEYLSFQVRRNFCGLTFMMVVLWAEVL